MASTASASEAARVTWLGHATVLLQAGGTTLLTDPVLRPRLAHLRRHAATPAVPRDVDALLISHAHHDHLDRRSLRLLGDVGVAIAPRGTARALRAAPVRDVVEARPGDVRQVGAAAVRAVRAEHDGRRTPLARAAPTLGYVVELGGLRVFFAGDTAYFDGLGDALAGGPLDLALLPVWGWGPSLGPGHMDPRDAARAAALLRPRMAVPIHWGTFLPAGLGRSHGHLLRDPAHAFARHAAGLAPGVDVRILAPGGALALEPRRRA
jgi:L-ascorbate metabolism protein UlaG (beta-lactamase superfamily)